MSIEFNGFESNNKLMNLKSNGLNQLSVKQYYDSEDDEETLATTIEDLSSLILYTSHSPNDIESFQIQMEDSTNPNISLCQNTYFMDGGVRFISLPMLGTSNTKSTLNISRLFEDWLANKLYSHPNTTVNISNNTPYYSTEEELNHNIPILEDHIELLSEDIINLFKSKKKYLKGISNILIKIRTGHVYSYHQLENGQPIITEDMESFFQQFPLFVECFIYVTFDETHLNEINILLLFENTSLNPGNPYKIMDYI